MPIYQIELTNYCNSSCKWCNHSAMKRKCGFMDEETFKRCIGLIEKEGIARGPQRENAVGLHHFGESLLHPKIEEFLEYLKEKNINWILSTNGRLLEKSEVRKMLLKFSGTLVISMENGGNIDDVNKLIKEKTDCGSKLKIILQSFGDTDFGQIIPGDYEILIIEKHSWAQSGNGEYKKCSFLSKDWVCILWDGTISSCCMDMEGEAILGHINTARIKNHPWRSCYTCEVVEKSNVIYSD